jgi:hypothetical protein
MRKLKVSIIVSLVSFISVVSSCSHITHRARVNEGFNMSGAVIQDYETTDPPEGSWEAQENGGASTEYLRTDFLVNIGYASKLKDERKFMIYLNMATADRDPFRFMPSAGFYYQVTPDSLPYASGIGAVVMGDPLIYYIWGRDIGRTKKGGSIASIDLAGGFSLIPSLFAHVKILKSVGPLELGIVGEYRRFWGTLNFCLDTGCTYIKSESYFGIILIPEFH